MPLRFAQITAVCTAIFFLLFPADYPAVYCDADSTAPSFQWISPREYAILTTNTIRLCVEARDNDGGSGIAKVRFYARYYDSNDRMTPLTFIGEATNHPYEIMWDCSGIPDQNLGKLQFFCEVYDKAGNKSTAPDQQFEYGFPQLVLDRNPQLSNAALISHYTRKTITVDGDLHEWSVPDSIEFFNNDNSIVAFSYWNKENLYIAVRVTGRSFISHYPPGSDNIVGMALEDEIELFFDTNHDHHEYFSYPDRHFLIAAAGMVFERRILIDTAYRSELIIKPNVNVSVKVDGTLNDDSDEDKCYTIEFAITWKELGITPANGSSMGLEIWNNDKDFIDGTYFFSGWSTNASNLSNSSEWGNLVLHKSESKHLETIAIASIVLLGGIFFYLYRRRTKGENARVPVLDENEYIRKAKSIVGERYTEESLTREIVAPEVGLTPSYFGKLFKQETGINFSDYVTDYRIEKAKELLASTHKNISEIALEVGFSSQSYFTYLFKKRIEKSPSEFRTEARKKQPSPKI